ncbi:MAG: hypothetical protein ACREMZ_03270 [Gemmatimonadales bacterium]
MPHQEHSAIREGLLAGLIGALVVVAWYFVMDLGRGQILYTPSVMGQVFVQGDTIPAVRTVATEAVVQYSLLHFGWFLLFGIGLGALTHLAARTPAFRMGIWLFLMVGFLFFLGMSYTLYWLTDQRFPWLTSMVGGLLGIGSMGFYLWRRHPGLRGTFQQAPLGDEVRPPPHPPGSPRV